MITLWDLLSPVISRGKAKARAKPQPKRPVVAAPSTPSKPARTPRAKAAATSAPVGMQAKYDAVTELMLAKYEVRVRKWRSAMSGIAWYVTYKDGRKVRLIEAPKPKGPMSAAVFLHEIGHHAIGFDTYKPRCLEEYHAWAWALSAMEEHDLNITEGVRRRMHLSLWYAVEKAKRRGIKSVPDELTPFLERPPRKRK